MIAFSAWDILRNLLLAARWTVVLSLVALLGGGMLAITVALARVGRLRMVHTGAKLFIEVFQGTPLLMQLFLSYYGLALLGVNVPAWAAASLSLILWTGAFLGEIWRGCIDAVSKGQWEASASLGLKYRDQFRLIIFPQAMRLGIAPSIGFSVQVIKGTALTSIIGFTELSRAGSAITNATFRPLIVYGLVALLYFALCWPLAHASRRVERGLSLRLGPS